MKTWRTPLLLTLLLAAAAAQAQPAPAARPQVGLRCEAVGSGPMLDCVVTLATREGAALAGAEVALGATMPSMPMAHAVKPARAVPTGKAGEYRGRLELEMSGVWAVQVDITGPLRERVVRRLQADECAGNTPRCEVRPAAARP